MEIEIRRMEDNDFHKVRKIIADNFAIEKEKVKNDKCLEFVACKDKEVVGYFILNVISDVVKNDKWFLVEYVCVDIEYQELGIGTKMMEFAIAFGKKMGVSYLELTSGFKREKAHHIYEKLGFIKRESYIYRRML